jgi:hypothetical protein
VMPCVVASLPMQPRSMVVVVTRQA